MKIIYKIGNRINERERRRKERLRTINRWIIRQEKLLRGCELCGRHDVPLHELHFHHRNPLKKRRKISHMITSATDVLIDELSHCNLWCRWSHENYHRTGLAVHCPSAFSKRRAGEESEVVHGR